MFVPAWEYQEHSHMWKTLPVVNHVPIPGEILKDFVHVFSSISSGFEGICRFLRPKTVQASYSVYLISL